MDEETTHMNLRDPKYLRVAALLLPLLASGCAVVPDGGVVYHSGHGAPVYSTGHVYGYKATYGYGYPVRPPVATVYVAPPPPVIVRPAPVIALPAHRPPAWGWRGEDRRQGHRHGHRDGHGGHGGRGHHGDHRGDHRGDHDRGGPGWRGGR